MTVEQFNNTAFSNATKVSFRGEVFQVSSIDFIKKQIVYKIKISDSFFDVTKDCEAVEIVEEEKHIIRQ